AVLKAFGARCLRDKRQLSCKKHHGCPRVALRRRRSEFQPDSSKVFALRSANASSPPRRAAGEDARRALVVLFARFTTRPAEFPKWESPAGPGNYFTVWMPTSTWWAQ